MISPTDRVWWSGEVFGRELFGFESRTITNKPSVVMVGWRGGRIFLFIPVVNRSESPTSNLARPVCKFLNLLLREHSEHDNTVETLFESLFGVFKSLRVD